MTQGCHVLETQSKVRHQHVTILHREPSHSPGSQSCETGRTNSLIEKTSMSRTASINRPPLVQRLGRLVNDLVRVRDGELVPRGTDPALLRWEDDDNVYLEISLSGSSGLDADISVWAGRMVIRVAR
jgi:hypothetical protein